MNLDTLIREMVREEIKDKCPTDFGILSMIDRRLESSQVTNMICERLNKLESKPAQDDTLAAAKEICEQWTSMRSREGLEDLFAAIIRKHTRPPSVTVTAEDLYVADNPILCEKKPWFMADQILIERYERMVKRLRERK